MVLPFFLRLQQSFERTSQASPSLQCHNNSVVAWEDVNKGKPFWQPGSCLHCSVLNNSLLGRLCVISDEATLHASDSLQLSLLLLPAQTYSNKPLQTIHGWHLLTFFIRSPQSTLQSHTPPLLLNAWWMNWDLKRLRSNPTTYQCTWRYSVFAGLGLRARNLVDAEGVQLLPGYFLLEHGTTHKLAKAAAR